MGPAPCVPPRPLWQSTDGHVQEDMWEYATRPRRTIAEVLGDFHSVRIPRDHVCDALPALRPRLFSLASAACVRRPPP
jgi:sulfite reductase alpha subunit-like flavoprotein